MSLQISISNAIGSRGVTAAGGYDPDAQAFITAAAITDPTQQSAINTLVTDLKGYSIWTKFKAIYPIVGGSAASHAVNLKTPGTYNMTFATGWTHSSTGMTPNGATYADTSLNINTVMSLNSMAFGVYSRTNTAAGNKAHGAEPPYTIILERNASNVAYASINDNGFTGVTVASSDSRGFFQASRTASNALRIVRNTTHATSTAATNSKPNLNFYFGASAINLTGSFVRPNDRQIAFGYIADGFTQTECDNLYTAVQAYQTTLGRSIGTQTVSDADAQAFVNAANIIDQVQANAINDLVIGMKADGIWTKMKAIYPVVGGVASSHAVNLKTPGTFNLTFASGWSHSANGMTPTNAYANTGFNPLTQSLPRNSAGMGVYNRTNTSTTGAHGQRVSNTFEIFERWTNNVAYCYINDNSGGFQVVNLISTGFFQGSRTASNAIRLNINTTQNTGTQASTGDSNGNLWIGASNDGGSGTFFNNREIAFFYIAEGFDNTEMQNIYTRVQAYQTALNRQV